MPKIYDESIEEMTERLLNMRMILQETPKENKTDESYKEYRKLYMRIKYRTNDDLRNKKLFYRNIK